MSLVELFCDVDDDVGKTVQSSTTKTALTVDADDMNGKDFLTIKGTLAGIGGVIAFASHQQSSGATRFAPNDQGDNGRERLLFQVGDTVSDELDYDCLLVQVAEKLVEDVRAWEIPEDYEPGDFSYNQILAEIRHEYTNYEELLGELPIQWVPISDGAGYCPCPLWDETLDECSEATYAHYQQLSVLSVES